MSLRKAFERANATPDEVLIRLYEQQSAGHIVGSYTKHLLLSFVSVSLSSASAYPLTGFYYCIGIGCAAPVVAYIVAIIIAGVTNQNNIRFSITNTSSPPWPPEYNICGLIATLEITFQPFL